MSAVSETTSLQGCPSALAPPEQSPAIDPTPHVRRANGEERLELAIFGAKCAACISKIEKAMLGLDGIVFARLNLSTGKLALRWREGAVDPREVTETLAGLGYRAAAFDPETLKSDADEEGRQLLRSLGVAGFALANVMLLSVSVWAGAGEMGAGVRALFHLVSALIAVPCALYAAKPFFNSATAALRARSANMDVPISLAVILSLSISIYEFLHGGEHTYFDAALMLLFFLLIGRYLDHRLRLKARTAARDLVALQSISVSRLTENGVLEPVLAREIQIGDRILLSPGDRAPVDGIIEDGLSDVDQSIINGESAPKQVAIGEKLYSGVLNLTSRLVMRAEKIADDSLVAELTRLVEAGEQSKSRYVRLADRAAALYVPIVHSLALLTFVGWLTLSDAGLRVAVVNAVAVLIITCPCALGLAAPAVQVVATGRLFKSGILVKSGDALERLSEVDLFVFDKTGTLTFGDMRLANSEKISGEVLQQAAQLARISRHPIAKGVVASVGPGLVSKDAVEEVNCGVSGIVDGKPARFGRREWVFELSDDTSAHHDPDETPPAAEAWFWREGASPVRFMFHDAPRNDAIETIEKLKAQGFGVELLSGDRREIVQRMAEIVGIKKWSSGLRPTDKTARLENLAADGVKSAMVGDGLNDAPSLAAAHASLSPGTAADASQATADFVYQGDGISPILEAHMVSRKARRRVLENFGFAALYNICAVPLAAFGFVTPLIAALAMSGSSMVVTLNAMRLARK
ncbi:MAG: heavy metal translocating P-type ATPase [Pseudomonadota bacterium]